MGLKQAIKDINEFNKLDKKFSKQAKEKNGIKEITSKDKVKGFLKKTLEDSRKRHSKKQKSMRISKVGFKKKKDKEIFSSNEDFRDQFSNKNDFKSQFEERKRKGGKGIFE